ncbi:MAG: hypothetical protein DSM107014_12815 [Gomphosphaeria aponina SAG 52.96 = DSM 107014]|uniref:Uncharacterized protein n=1 Tax=Gomphosphaeria aponina SAG 52.96 = DSM 107014 TaxID=1521640 RepID=A0A941JSP9_9CHRO|nr:hypothetical protein [Gomphosphaeria aponina SAG 52.96 = DSM 107014]
MTHTFLIDAGRWLLEGNWLERNQKPIPVKGGTIINWNEENWFTMVTNLVFPRSDRHDINFEYRGHLRSDQQPYTYVLKQSLLGRIEGEGWIAPQSIVHRYWLLSDKQRRHGFETFYIIDENTYHFASGIMAGQYLASTMEAILKRQT